MVGCTFFFFHIVFASLYSSVSPIFLPLSSPVYSRPCPAHPCVQMVEHLFVSCPLFDHLLGRFTFLYSRRRKNPSSKPTNWQHQQQSNMCPHCPILSPVVKCVYSASTELFVCSQKTNETRIMKEKRARYKKDTWKNVCVHFSNCLR